MKIGDEIRFITRDGRMPIYVYSPDIKGLNGVVMVGSYLPEFIENKGIIVDTVFIRSVSYFLVRYLTIDHGYNILAVKPEHLILMINNEEILEEIIKKLS